MIAEICGKISKSGSNLHDRLEDKLTGDVFGNLRYVPFDKAMKKILTNAVYPRSVAEIFNDIDASFWNNNIKFWPYDNDGELDILLEFDNVIVGIEVKYMSGLSSDDGANFSEQAELRYLLEEPLNSQHQLARESRIVADRGGGKKKVLIFIANSSSCRDIYNDTKKRCLVSKDVELGYLSWQALLNELLHLKLDNEFEGLIIEDIIKLLRKKGLDQYVNMCMDIDYIINGSSYYRFNIKNQSAFCFDMNINVKGDLYYEFR